MNTGILDRHIDFHRCFVTLTGSVNAALMLSEAYHKQRLHNDWWPKTCNEWEHHTGLTRDNQETARRALKKFPFWKEELRGLPAKLHFYVDIERLKLSLGGVS